MHRLEHGRILPFRIDIGGSRNADAAGNGRPQVGENVTEQIAADHHAEALRMSDEARGKRVDVHLLAFDLGVAFGDLPEHLVPERHAEIDAIGFGGRGDFLLADPARELERIADDALGAHAGEYADLADHFVGRAGVNAAAHVRVLAFIVFAYHHEVDVLRAAGGKRRLHSRQQLYRPHTGVLLEAAAYRRDQLPQRDVVRHAGKPDGT